jgi:sodium transport system permease protein
MKPRFVTVLLKELRETLRDKRTLVMLALFTMMYPAVIGLVMHQMVNRATKAEREGAEIAVIGAARAPTLMTMLRQKNFTVRETEPMDEQAITALLHAKKKTAAVLRLSDKFGEDYQAMRPAGIEMWYDTAVDTGVRPRDIEEVVTAYSSNIASARLLAHGVSPAALSPIKLQRYDTGTNASRSAAIIGGVLMSLFLPAFMLSMATAIDSTAGERERRSLEVLMAQPARAWELVVGKWLAASVVAVVGMTLELALAHALLSWLPLEEAGLSWSMSWFGLFLMCVAAVPLSLFAGAAQIAMAMNSKSFKEAQSMLTFFTLGAMVPGLAVSMLELKTANWMYLVPVLSNHTLMREAAKTGQVDMLPFLLTFGSSLLLALAAVGFSAWRMKSERYVLAV